MKWEYLVLTTSVTGSRISADEFVYNLNGENITTPYPHKDHQQYYMEFIPRLLAQLGEQDWELCAGEGRPFLYFKRPKS